ncbi:hypothetical protein D3C71_2160720 [compost metagenome]
MRKVLLTIWLYGAQAITLAAAKRNTQSLSVSQATFNDGSTKSSFLVRVCHLLSRSVSEGVPP